MPTHFRKVLKTLCSSYYISPYDCPMPFLSTETLTTAISPSLPFSAHALCFLLKVKTLNRNSPNFQPNNCVSLQLHPSSLFLLKQSKYTFLSKIVCPYVLSSQGSCFIFLTSDCYIINLFFYLKFFYQH